jgi:hypothetical protein
MALAGRLRRKERDMKPGRAVILLTILALFAPAGASRPGASADTPNVAGRWTLNRTLSRIPEDIGFGMDLLGSTSDAAGRGDTSGTAAAALFRESADDAARREHLVDEVRRPPEELAITQTEDSVIIAADRGKPRTFSLDGRESAQKLGLVTVMSSARWNGARLEIRYRVQENREVRYEYTRTADPARLTVDVRFVERGGRDTAVLVYEPARDGAPAPPAPARPAAGASPAAGAPAAAPPAAPPPTLGGLGQGARGGGLAQPPPSRPALPTLAPPPPTAPTQQPAPGPIGPDAALTGLTRLGMVVEELRPQAAACGLAQAPIEALVSKAFTDAGMKVVKDTDEDTYVYVDIGTISVNPGLCISRYDISLITNTMAALSYQPRPVLVQVQLLHQGGMAGGAPTVHGDAVRKSVKQAVDDFVSRIRTANGAGK